MVPFDGSALSESALAKARLFAIAIDEAPADLADVFRPDGRVTLSVVSVIPESARTAQEYGWVDADEEFTVRRVVERLHHHVMELAPNANFVSERVSASASAGTIGRTIREKALDIGVTDVFIGSENAGRIVSPVTSVGSGIAADQTYDVHIIRHRVPHVVLRRLRSRSPRRS